MILFNFLYFIPSLCKAVNVGKGACVAWFTNQLSAMLDRWEWARLAVCPMTHDRPILAHKSFEAA